MTHDSTIRPLIPLSIFLTANKQLNATTDLPEERRSRDLWHSYINKPRKIENPHGNLSHEIRIRRRWNHWPLSGNAGIATIILENTPYTSVLLSYSRLRDEYLEAEHFRNLHLTIALSLDGNARDTTEDVSDQRINDQILPRIKSVTVLLTKKGSGKIYDHLWFNVFILSKMLATRSPNLEMIKVVAHERREVPTRTLQLAYAVSNLVES
ncbi:hypothetical protein BDU57DRAFT_537180 [Ampelomyces quisqualis]|uniref:Uncharacterized protein n=1 Tax=Ampelomyces quisqualis TaxID=50730 RepID=A0A6A5QQ36_AMPQU|nr:hypothetical protein BDU57DRAFT_537180 [Ampelomyces quisqualis]